MKLTKHIPNTITCLNLISGCLAVIMAFRLDQEMAGLSCRIWCYIFIGTAALFDFCDGLAARLLKAYSAIGKELDSLSDLVSFGVAPGLLMYNTMDQYTPHLWVCIVALFIPVMGALRLAKFNVDDSQATTFKGLPIPANALFWIGMTDWIARYMYPGYVITTIIIVLISLTMVCNVKMFSLKFKNLSFQDNVKRYAILLAAAIFVVVYGFTGLAWTILLYILISAFSKR